MRVHSTRWVGNYHQKNDHIGKVTCNVNKTPEKRKQALDYIADEKRNPGQHKPGRLHLPMGMTLKDASVKARDRQVWKKQTTWCASH